MVATKNSKNQLIFSISAVLVAIILVCVLPCDIDAQTLHNQTLDAIVKQTNVSKGNSQISVGANPVSIAVTNSKIYAPLKNAIYVANSGSDTVSVISASNNTKEKDIPVGKNPRYLAVDVRTGTIYVSNLGSDTVSVISVSNHTNEKPLLVGKNPFSLAVDDTTDTIYVANSGSDTVSVISASNNTKEKDIPVGKFPSNLAFDNITRTIYVANLASDTVSVINGNSYSFEKNIPVGKEPIDLAVDESRATIYVANSGSDTVSVIDENFPSFNKNITVGKYPKYLAVDYKSYKSDTIYVSNSGSDTVSVINGSSYSLYKNITVGTNPGYIAVDHKSDTIYVTHLGSDTVSVINGTSYSFEKNITVGKHPRYLAVDDNTDTIYVADYDSNGISVIDGISKNLVAGVTFNINPANSGHITCNDIENDTETPINQYLYVSSGSTCTAKANTGFKFSSWVENSGHNSTRTIKRSTVSDSPLDIFSKPNDTVATIDVTKFGTFTANFRTLPPPIPPEYSLLFIGLTVSVIIPSILHWINGWRQRRNLDDYIKKLPSKLNQNDAEKEIRDLYIKGKISESHLKILNEMIATKFKA